MSSSACLFISIICMVFRSTRNIAPCTILNSFIRLSLLSSISLNPLEIILIDGANINTTANKINKRIE